MRLLRLALAGTTLATLGYAVPPAFAVSYAGGCAYKATGVGGEGTMTGVVYATVVLTDPVGAEATVRCEFRINGVPQPPGHVGSGAGVVAFAQQFTIVSPGMEDHFALCTTVTTGSGSATTCADGSSLQVPPDAVADLNAVVADVVDGVWVSLVDPLVCPVLTAAGIGDDVYDCPPYEG